MGTLVLNDEEFTKLFGGVIRQHPADLREAMRAVLNELSDTARDVYDRENIHDPNTRLCDVVRTVLYAFDQYNRSRVADVLGLADNELMLLLVGYELGRQDMQRDVLAHTAEMHGRFLE